MRVKPIVLVMSALLLVAAIVGTGVLTRADDILGSGIASTTATVSNSAPVIDIIRISNTAYGSDDFTGGILPTIGGTKTIHINGTISDSNGEDDIATTTVSAVFYRTTVSGDVSCTSDKNDCYRLSSCAVNVAAGSATEVAYDCSIDLSYWIDATAVGGRYDSDIWTAYVSTTDIAGATSSATTTVEVNPLLALNIPEAISYGTRALDEETSSTTNQETILTQKGNVAADVELSGSTMVCDVLGNIPVTNQRWALSDVGYANATNTLSATGTAAQRNIGYRNSETAEVTKTIYWDIKIPAGGVKGVCTGSNTMSIVAVPPEQGTLFDGRLVNVRYTSDTYSGYTDTDGNFNYEPGETVTFSVGAVTLGSMPTDTINVDQKVFFQDMLGLDRSNVTDEGLLKRARFIQSIATDPASTTRLVIPANAYTALTSSIDFSTVSEVQLEAKVQLVHVARALVTEAAAQEHIVAVLSNEGVLTSTPPTVTTPTSASVGTSSATLGGTVTSNGGLNLTARGTCWGTSPNPTSNCVAASGVSTGAFTHVRTSLPPATLIYYRAYATNSAGTAYSADGTFTTSHVAAVVTSPTATDAYGSGATLGGTVTFDSSSPITERGTCWGTSEESLTNCLAASGTSSGAFSHLRTGFAYSTTIYYRAYAVNAAGTAYSPTTSFVTPVFTCGTEVITYDGFNYNTVTRSSQCWLQQSMRTGTQLASASTFPTNNGTVEKWCYNDSSANCTADGALYSWDEAMGYSTTAGAQGICPTGWHIPTDAEFKSLEIEQGMAQGTADLTGFRGTDQSTRLRVGGSSNMEFQLAGDRRIGNDFYGRTTNAYIWTSTQSSSNAYARELYSGLGTINRFVDSKNYGFTVRCVSDTPVGSLPTVTSPTSASVSFDSAVLGGTVSSDGGITITDRGTCWGTTTNPTTNCASASGTTGTFTHTRIGLPSGTLIYYRAYATNALGTSYSATASFTTTTFSCGTSTLVHQGVTYTTVAQGSQCWLGGNISHGSMLASASTFPTNNGTVEKWCYNNSSANCTADGALYSWDEAMGYSTTAGAQGICPTGWHIPTDTEFKTLEVTLGMTQGVADSTGFRGTDQGTKLKVGGSSGLNFQLAGDRRTLNDFYGRTTNAYIWTSTQSSSNAYARGLYTGFPTIDRFADSKNFGFTVRCLKD